MNFPKKAFLLALVASMGLVNSSHASLVKTLEEKEKQQAQLNINNVYELLSYQDRSQREKKANIDAMQKATRLAALQELAYNLAIRASINSRLSTANDVIANNSRDLDAIYNFVPLMIEGRVIPPVITEAKDIYTQGSDRQIRLSGAVYDIFSQAKFSSVAPNWREYLNFPDVNSAYDPLIYGNIGFEPETKEEEEAWVNATLKGWSDGENQANDLITQAFDRLNRDYTGMVRFHKFVLEGKITMPVISSYNLYDSNLGERFILDETLLQIESLPVFSQAKATDMNFRQFNVQKLSWSEQVQSPVVLENSETVNTGIDVVEKNLQKIMKGEDLQQPDFQYPETPKSYTDGVLNVVENKGTYLDETITKTIKVYEPKFVKPVDTGSGVQLPTDDWQKYKEFMEQRSDASSKEIAEPKKTIVVDADNNVVGEIVEPANNLENSVLKPSTPAIESDDNSVKKDSSTAISQPILPSLKDFKWGRE